MSKCHYSFGRGRRPKGPTFARGTIRSLLKDLELADNARHMTTRRAHPAVTFFGTLISRSFSFVCVVRQFIFSLSVQDSFFCLSFHFQFSFAFHFRFSFIYSFLCRVLVPAISSFFQFSTVVRLWSVLWGHVRITL
jgi:hypothetical protein